MSKKETCTHFVRLTHLNVIERRAAASWAIEKFGLENVDLMRPREKIGSRGLGYEQGFWFAREKDAVFFTLRWSSR